MNSTLANFTLLETSQSFVFPVSLTLTYIPFLLGFSLNCYIIFFLLSRGGSLDVSAVFALNHATAEIFFSMSCFLIFVTVDISNYLVYVLLNFLNGTSMITRLLFLCCVCLERYLAVVHPVTFLRFKPIRYRITCSVSIWICSLVLVIIMETLACYEALIGVFFNILGVEFFCCVTILRRLRDPGPRDMGREQGEMNAAKKKEFQIVSINLLTCLAQIVPSAVLYILNYSTLFDDLSTVNFTSTTINIFAGFVQPVMILHKAGKLTFVRCS